MADTGVVGHCEKGHFHNTKAHHFDEYHSWEDGYYCSRDYFVDHNGSVGHRCCYDHEIVHGDIFRGDLASPWIAHVLPCCAV